MLFSSGDKIIEKMQSVKIWSIHYLESIIKILRSGDLDDHKIKSKVPWHVINNANFLIDLESVDNKLDCSTDAWRCSISKIYVILSLSFENIPTTKYNNRSLSCSEKKLQMSSG